MRFKFVAKPVKPWNAEVAGFKCYKLTVSRHGSTYYAAWKPGDVSPDLFTGSQKRTVANGVYYQLLDRVMLAIKASEPSPRIADWCKGFD